MSDSAQFHQKEYWRTAQEIEDSLNQYGNYAGDCEDYATRAKALAEKDGIKARYADVLDENGERHLVTLLDDEIVVDNRLPEPVHWKNSGYRFLRVSGDKPGSNWREVENELPKADVGVWTPPPDFVPNRVASNNLRRVK